MRGIDHDLLTGATGALNGLSPPFVLLEDRLRPEAGGLLLRDPTRVIVCEALETLDAALGAIVAGLDAGLHAAGWFSYELGHALQPRLRRHLAAAGPTPLLWFGLFPPPLAIAAPVLDAAFAALGPPPPIAGLRPDHDRATHVAKVREILTLIGAGDIYQANLTFPMRFDYRGDPLALYAALRAAQPVAHGGLIATGSASILSVSPELWVDITDGQATARPMKGTTARRSDPAEDQAAAEALRADPKQRAENLMIVDLLRNDLARISAPGSVRAPALFALETYPSFHTLTSTITARPRADLGLRARLEALFPCGSIVGAPKIRAAQILARLEGAPRGVYTGSIGVLAPGGDMTFNVAIRTAVIDAEGRGAFGVGGGIVADSDPDAEYDEALLKAKVLTDLAGDYALLETLRWSAREGFIRLPAHLDRMGRSAAQLGFAFDRAEIETGLAARADQWRDGDRRVRIALARDGVAAITDADLSPLAPPHAAPLKVVLAETRLDPGDPFLRHKTSRRGVYDRAFAEASARGCDEALFLNRRGELAEASRGNLFARIDGVLVTPPLNCGVLPGVLRRVLIERGEAVEGVLTSPLLASAEAWYVGSSLRGLRRAILVR